MFCAQKLMSIMPKINTYSKTSNATYARRIGLLLGLFLVQLFLINYVTNFQFVSLEQLGFLLLGMVGAIFANSTGAGGGVVFIPVFAHFGFSEAQAISTSFGIQCFGMTAGAVTWCVYYANTNELNRQGWQDFLPVVGIASLFSIIGLWHNYVSELAAPATLNKIFSTFSLLLGLSLLATIYFVRPRPIIPRLNSLDVVLLGVIAYFGGIITAWLSVGVGEVVAFYLILRRFDVTMSVAAAVVISAITVWSATPHHFYPDSAANWEVLTFAGPGAVIGGIAARRLVGQLSARRLKVFFAVWLLIIGLAS
jgi:uncharacterized membrane protein YfcA